MPKNSRAKGCRGEREFCAFLKERGYRARRSQQFMGAPGEDAADVITALDALFYLDVKRTERLFPIEWLTKATSDRGSATSDTRKPVIAWKKNRGEWIAMLSFHDLVFLLRDKFPTPFSEPLGDDDGPTSPREGEPPASRQRLDPIDETR